ncbi:ER lumen protein retaining receptor [Thamnocephalis sphaerospora]|uniref:ER lumen protein retaining receptor n=1 Tax=Thamnocephalis sphaerospora TaxID=78915 RepID=A0A4P9XP16_9FUNG|nr:ER lumen protein retaining receptor [Thamnocephalis sphaerospora]|eukprot:RKP07744.1 ER lumen protein retaining receptor [Thamnocephalis sphaerospora]
MNIFRLTGDMMHLASILILLLKIHTSHSCAGISFKTQVLYLTVFLTRYLDLFTNFTSVYLTCMKIFFIASSAYIIYLMRFPFKDTYNKHLDAFRWEFLLGGAAVLALVFPQKYTVREVFWTYSIFLEMLAILPQLFQLQRTGEAATITTHYLFALGAYRALYIANWIYRYQMGEHVDGVAVLAGIVQTALYCDFFYIYFTRVLRGQRFKLPV